MPAAAQHADLAIVVHGGGAGDLHEPCAQPGRQARLRDPDLLEGHGPRDDLARHAERVLQEGRGVVGQRRPGPRLAPAPEHLLAPAHSVPPSTKLASPASASRLCMRAARRTRNGAIRAQPRGRCSMISVTSVPPRTASRVISAALC